jgi:hypothetical protein
MLRMLFATGAIGWLYWRDVPLNATVHCGPPSLLTVRNMLVITKT